MISPFDWSGHWRNQYRYVITGFNSINNFADKAGHFPDFFKVSGAKIVFF
jgi:hypothetical protein